MANTKSLSNRRMPMASVPRLHQEQPTTDRLRATLAGVHHKRGATAAREQPWMIPRCSPAQRGLLRCDVPVLVQLPVVLFLTLLLILALEGLPRQLINPEDGLHWILQQQI